MEDNNQQQNQNGQQNYTQPQNENTNQNYTKQSNENINQNYNGQPNGYAIYSKCINYSISILCN